MAAGDFTFFEGFEGDAQSYVFETMQLTRDGEFARTADFGIGWEGTGNVVASSPVIPQTTELVAGCAFKWTSVANGTFSLMSLHSPGDFLGVRVGISTQRLLYIETPDGAGAYVVRQLSEFALDLDAWYFIEVYALAHATDGVVTVQVNGPQGTQNTTGAEVMHVEGVRTLHPLAWFANYNQVSWGVMAGTPSEDHHCAFDDVYTREGDEFAGDCATVLQALEDDRDVEFTRSSGAKNFEMVDEVDPDEDGTYNATDVDAQDILEVGDAAFTGQILALQLVGRYRKTNTQVWTVELAIDLAGVFDYGPPRFIPYPDYETSPPAVFNTAPGSLAWTIARLNAIGVGYRALTP